MVGRKPRPRAGTLWRHYKGNEYKVVGSATCSETKKPLVLYREARRGQGTKTWARPLEMWFEIVDNNGTQRFELIEDCRSGKSGARGGLMEDAR